MVVVRVWRGAWACRAALALPVRVGHRDARLMVGAARARALQTRSGHRNAPIGTGVPLPAAKCSNIVVGMACELPILRQAPSSQLGEMRIAEWGIGAMRSSRTYKLMLSDDGIDLYLACHHRLSCLLRDFIPYGVTLAVAVSFLDRLDACDIAAELERRKFVRCLGTRPRFVGSSGQLANRVGQLRTKLKESNEFAKLPSVAMLYIVALLSLESAEDEQLIEAYHRTTT